MDSPRSPVSPSWEVAAGDPALDQTHSPRSADECSFREACPFAIGLFLVLVVALTLLVTSLAWAGSARAQATGLDAVPIGGFQPWVAFTLTDEFSNENQDDLFFVADVDSTFNPSRSLPNSGSPIYQLGLLDSGSQVNLLTDEATTAFDVVGQGFGGTEVIEAQGVSGSEFLIVQDPLGIFTTGLQNASGGAAVTVSDTSTLRGLKSNAPASAPAGSVLPNVIGLPMMSTHTTVIRNSQPQFIQDGDETFRAPAVEFLQLSDPIPSDFSRRAALGLEVNASLGTTEPVYVFNLNNALNGDPLHDNPATPTAITGAFFTDIDIANAGTTRTAEVFFDTGAQVTVVNELLAAQLGFDVVNDEPDFTVPIIGVGGAQADIPGFVADSLTIPAVGGSFTATEVPIVVLENVPNPLGAGILDGILGTNVFWDRDLVVDPTGDRLWISDPVTDFKPTVGQSFALVNWSDGAIWDGGTVPGETDVVAVRRGVEFDVNTARVFRLAVEAGGELFVRRFGNGGADLSVYTDASIEAGATLHVSGDGVFSATSIEVQDGGNVRSAGFGRLEGDVTLNGQLNPTEGNFEIGGSLTVGTTGEITIAPSFALSQFGQRSPIAVESVLTLDGTLTLRPSFGFREVGDSGELITAESVLGRFETIDYGDAIDGESWAVTYTETAVVVTWALFGDANLDQQVEQGDLNAVLNNWGLAGQAWATGDFNGDGFIDQTDLNAVLNNWGSSVAPSFEGFAVPESAVGLAVLGVLGLVRRGARWGRVA